MVLGPRLRGRMIRKLLNFLRGRDKTALLRWQFRHLDAEQKAHLQAYTRHLQSRM